jgi:homoserine O-acetyltransferase
LRPAGRRLSPELGETYLDYQGEKFLKRFHAESYLVLSRAMDTHDVGPGPGRAWRRP